MNDRAHSASLFHNNRICNTYSGNINNARLTNPLYSQQQNNNHTTLPITPSIRTSHPFTRLSFKHHAPLGECTPPKAAPPAAALLPSQPPQWSRDPTQPRHPPRTLPTPHHPSTQHSSSKRALLPTQGPPQGAQPWSPLGRPPPVAYSFHTTRHLVLACCRASTQRTCRFLAFRRWGARPRCSTRACPCLEPWGEGFPTACPLQWRRWRLLQRAWATR